MTVMNPSAPLQLLPETAPERRGLPDRRRRPTSMFAPFTSPGRRRRFRRSGEELNAYVDCPSRRVQVWAVAMITLSALDAILTLVHIRGGRQELSPTMDLALSHGDTAFVASKMAVTALGVFLLALHQNFTLARFAFRALLLSYCLLIGYHLFLLAFR
jgi:hypothetical protein